MGTRRQFSRELGKGYPVTGCSRGKRMEQYDHVRRRDIERRLESNRNPWQWYLPIAVAIMLGTLAADLIRWTASMYIATKMIEGFGSSVSRSLQRALPPAPQITPQQYTPPQAPRRAPATTPEQPPQDQGIWWSKP